MAGHPLAHGVRAALACIAMALGTAAAAADATQYLPVDPAAILRLNDLPRSRARLVATPYPRLADAPWASAVMTRMARVLPPTADVVSASSGIRRLVAGVTLPENAATPRLAVAAETIGDCASVARWCGAFYPCETPLDRATRAWIGGSGQITQFDQLFVFTTAIPGPVVAPLAAAPRAGARWPDGCCELELHPRSLARLMTRFGTAATLQPPAVSASLRLDPIGVRERLVIPFPARDAASFGGVAWPAARRELLATLPVDTLCAFTCRMEPTLAKRAFAPFAASVPGCEGLDTALAAVSLPPIGDLLATCEGDLLVYAVDGPLLPAITCAVGMQQADAHRLLTALAPSLGLRDDGDCTWHGLISLVDMHAGWVGGELVLTSDPAGIAAHRGRSAGFAEHAATRAALAELPPGALGVGVSRSAASWRAIGRLGAMALARAELPEAMSLPEDLEAAGRHGFVAYRLDHGEMVIDSGGLLGGPGTWYATVAGTVMWWAVSAMEDARRQLEAMPKREATAMTAGDLVF
ncbi:MAG: hypothetical protein H0W72_07175 [Planctomycetes bacterium]|nr:hypothetical protein [Planctomycetota bacterium]